MSPKVISLSEKIHRMVKRSKNAVLAAKSENDLCQLEFLLNQLEEHLLKLEDMNVQHPQSSNNDNIVEVRDSRNQIRTLELSGIKRMGENKATDIEVIHIRAMKITGGSLNLFSSEDKIWCA